MFNLIRTENVLFKILNDSLIDLPTPSNITVLWNFGSLLGFCLIIQILTGLFLSMHYTSDMTTAFSSVIHICRDVNNGWLIRTLHANGASFFFVCLYIHVGRGNPMYNSSLSNPSIYPSSLKSGKMFVENQMS